MIIENGIKSNLWGFLGWNLPLPTTARISERRTVVVYLHSFHRADALNDTALQSYNDGFGDNPISMHWLSKGTSYPAPSITSTWGVDDVNIHWDVTIKAGETQSFMMILVQNRLILQEAIDNATYIDSHPIKIYDSKCLNKKTHYILQVTLPCHLCWDRSSFSTNCIDVSNRSGVKVVYDDVFEHNSNVASSRRFVFRRVVDLEELQRMCSISTISDSEWDLIVHQFWRFSNTHHCWLRSVIHSRARWQHWHSTQCRQQHGVSTQWWLRTGVTVVSWLWARASHWYCHLPCCP